MAVEDITDGEECPELRHIKEKHYCGKGMPEISVKKGQKPAIPEDRICGIDHAERYCMGDYAKCSFYRGILKR